MMNVEKGGDETVILSELAIQTVVYHTLSYLYSVQSKKDDDIRHETIISHFIQYLVDDLPTPDNYRRKIMDIDTKRKIIGLAISELNTLYVPLKTLEKMIQFDTDIIKMYLKMLKYFDNYGFKFEIVSVEKVDVNRRKEQHILSVSVYESMARNKSDTEVREFVTKLVNEFGVSIKVDLNVYKGM